MLKHDLGRALLKLEELQTASLQAALKNDEAGPQLTDAEQAAAPELPQSPDLLARILADFDAGGVVGEEADKLVGYTMCYQYLSIEMVVAEGLFRSRPRNVSNFCTGEGDHL